MMSWTAELRRSVVKKGQHRADSLLMETPKMEGPKTPYLDLSEDDLRKVKEKSLMNVWKRLMVIRVSRSMAQKEVRFNWDKLKIVKLCYC